ncbi:phospholipase D-like domain-containing protein [Methanofollis fontis]|uniref:PLD phosphodiesterase domain-containing protein n=1 Tax=Methanofollis fontis TaxID=2052832 RepID=A0A483CSI4_9EURY|nr:phospholipase D-like domain-containing protein [Methanofollis fontis]TAJ44055.1 hypothetical protein CUJ86_08445 [Methanofollis fontis]
MAREDTINLIAEFTERQRHNDIIVLTTFCFDPYFFDKFLFHKIRSNNPFSEIIVLVDGQQYVQSMERSTNDTGRNYHLIPIYLPHGVFHPKIFLFGSTEKSTATVYIGSANLTMTGFTRNAEMVAKVEYSPENVDSTIESVKDFFQQLIHQKYIHDPRAVSTIQHLLGSLPSPADEASNADCIILHNMRSPILPLMLENLDQDSFSEVFLLAPFFAPDARVLQTIADQATISRIQIALQNGNHNLIDLTPYTEFSTRRGIPYEVVEAAFKDNYSRTFHSKILSLKGKEQHLLIGSPNMTQSALLEPADHGNVECAILFKGIQAKKILDRIEKKPVADIDTLLASGEGFEPSHSFPPVLRIYSAAYNDLSHSIEVHTEPLSEHTSVHCRVEGIPNPVDYMSDLSSGTCTITSLPKGIPTELLISSNRKSGRRRIYYDRKAYIRAIPGSKEPLKEMADRLTHDATLDTTDIHAILIGLSKRIDGKSEDGKTSEDGSPAKKRASSSHIPKPSKSTSGLGMAGSLGQLQRLYHSMILRRWEEHASESTTPEEIEENLVGHHARKTLISEDKKRRRLFEKCINQTNDILLHLVHQSDKDNLDDILVEAQSAFINLAMKSFPQLIGKPQLNQVMDILENNLQHVKREDCSQSSTVTLFAHILTINYCYDMHCLPQFLKNVFSCTDFTDPDSYYLVKDVVQQYQSHYMSEIAVFDLKKFHNHFCSLLCFVFNKYTIGWGPVELVQAIIDTEDEEHAEFLGKILNTLKHGVWGSTTRPISLISPQKYIRGLQLDFSTICPARAAYIKDFIEER